MNKEVLILKLRNAIADKEWIIAQANHDTTKFGEFQCDWNRAMLDCQGEVSDLIEQLEKLNKTNV